METYELKDKYKMLYNYMASSNNPKYMMLFGNIMNEMMDWMIENKPDTATEWIEKLCSVKWHNYLTKREAENIVNQMIPRAPWSRAVWNNAMESAGLPVEEEPYYNSCALWVTMNMIYSDSSETIASIMGKPLSEIPSEQLVGIIDRLALDKLKDKDEVFNIRHYFAEKI